MPKSKVAEGNLFTTSFPRNTLIIYLLNSMIIAAAFPIMKRFFDVSDQMLIFYMVLLPLGLGPFR